MMSDDTFIMVEHKSPPRCFNNRGHDPRSSPLSDSQDRPLRPAVFDSDCGKKGHARRGCHCDRCDYTRERERIYRNKWIKENDAHYKEHRKEYLKRTNNGTSKRYEKTRKGYLMRSYRNMQSRVDGIQKKGTWTGQELLPREEFYEWGLTHPVFEMLFSIYEANGYDRKLAPSPDRIDSSRGYTLDNMRWLTHSENSSLGARNAGKLSAEQIQAIRDESRTTSTRELADRYGVTYQRVWQLVKGT